MPENEIVQNILSQSTPEASLQRAAIIHKAKDNYNKAYKEYKEQHPVSILGMSWKPEYGYTQHPENRLNEAAYKYAVEQSGYDPGNPNEIWRNTDKALGQIGGESLLMMPLMASAAGAFGIAPKILADMKFAYDGAKTFSSPEGWRKTVNLFKQGKYGRAALSGLGDALDLSLAANGGKSIVSFGRFAKEWNKLRKLKTLPYNEAKLLEDTPLKDKAVNLIENNKFNILSSRGNQTNVDPNRYLTNAAILKDFKTGRNDALGYLKSQRKQNIDNYNKALFKRRLRDKVPIELELNIESNPYLRASTPMEKPNFHYNDQTGSWEGEIQLVDGKWQGADNNGFFLSKLGGNEYGRTAIIDKTNPKTDQLYLDTGADLDDSAFHEYLHRGRIANANDAVGNEFYIWKTKHLMKPTAREYLLYPEEAAVNLLEIGRRANITTMPYPGETKAKAIIQDIIKNDPVKGNMLNETKWETKPKRVWNALRGEYMGLIPIGIGIGVIENDK